MVGQCKVFTLKNVFTDHHVLTPLELREYIDFAPQRIYFITSPTSSSGAHCHFEERELFVMIQGQGVATVDDGGGLKEIPLKGPQNAIYVPNYVWHGFKDFSSDAIVFAVSSTNYCADRSDYLEDYAEFQRISAERLSGSGTKVEKNPR
ncbi:MAG: sugar 3,4-ketoisomerase [Candidatus Dormibacteraceae bacterium]